MPHDEVRYEYRVFASGCVELDARMRAAGGEPEYYESADTYIIPRENLPHSVKLRDGRLDTKFLRGSYRGLEQWAPLPKVGFPIADGMLADLLGPALHLEQPLPRGAGESEARLLETLRGCDSLLIVQIVKRRSVFSLGQCVAEIVAADCHGTALSSACVECADAGEAHALVVELGLDAWPNVSYMAAARGVLGLVGRQFEGIQSGETAHR
jgi:hypothetical protein